MAGKNRFVLVAVFVVALLLAGCAGQQVSPPEQQPAEQVIAPEPSPQEKEESTDPQPEPEYKHEAAVEEQVPAIASVAAQIYYDFFSNSFEVAEGMSRFGLVQMWGHNIADELRLTKLVFIRLIEGFDDPVLVLLEFTFYEDGINVSATGLLNAYLIRDGELCSDLNWAEFNMIFGEIEDGRGWMARCPDGVIQNIDLNGENLFFFDFAGASTEELMDMLLDKLREYI